MDQAKTITETHEVDPIGLNKKFKERLLKNPRPVIILVHGTNDGGPLLVAGDTEQCDKEHWWSGDGAVSTALRESLSTSGNGEPVILVMKWPYETKNQLISPITQDKLRFYGPNSEYYRYQSGVQVSNLIDDLEEINATLAETGRAQFPYVLIGHSHGGSVILHALKSYLNAGGDLPNLASWVTVGTPFIRLRPKLWLGWATGLHRWFPFLLSIIGVALVVNYLGGWNWFEESLLHGDNTAENRKMVLLFGAANFAVGVTCYMLGLLIAWLFGPFVYFFGRTISTLMRVFPDPIGSRLSHIFYFSTVREMSVDPFRKSARSHRVRHKAIICEKWRGYVHQLDEAIHLISATLEYRGPVLKPLKSARSSVGVVFILGVLALVEFGLGISIFNSIKWLLSPLIPNAGLRAFEQYFDDTNFTMIALLMATPIVIGALFIMIVPASWKAYRTLSSIFGTIAGALTKPFVGNVARIYRWLANKFLRRTLRDLVSGRDIPDAYRFEMMRTPHSTCTPSTLSDGVSEDIIATSQVALSRRAGALGILLAEISKNGGDISQAINSPDVRLAGGELIHTAYFYSPKFRQQLISDIARDLSDHKNS